MIEQLLTRHPLISDQIEKAELLVILRELQTVLGNGIKGDVVELGCYVGTTSLFLRRVLNELQSEKMLHVYDSFAGLPEKSAFDVSPAGIQFTAGVLTASKSTLRRNFIKAGLQPPLVHKGFFQDFDTNDMPAHIAFAFLDGDFYASIMQSLRLVWPHLSKGAVVVVDDYQSESLPGVCKAVDNWLLIHPAKLRITKSLAVLYN